MHQKQFSFRASIKTVYGYEDAKIKVSYFEFVMFLS